MNTIEKIQRSYIRGLTIECLMYRARAIDEYLINHPFAKRADAEKSIDGEVHRLVSETVSDETMMEKFLKRIGTQYSDGQPRLFFEYMNEKLRKPPCEG